MTSASLSPLAALPSPTTAVWQLGPFPIRAYALCIVLGIVVACAVTEVRLRRRGVAPWAVLDIAVWAVPFGIVGARIYHVITSPQGYFGADGDLGDIIRIWEGGLGIWGAVAGGALGAWLGARQLGIPFVVVADALAPGLPLAQAVGRFGNWFNNELYGGATTLPWGLEINRLEGGTAIRDGEGNPVTEPGLYHPTFAYEALWNVGVAALVLLVDRRFRLGRGRAFALYVMGYTAGRFWIEMMRTDEATLIGGVRVNVWVAALVFLGALSYFLRVRGPREYLVPSNAGAAAAPVDDAARRSGTDEGGETGVSQVKLGGDAGAETSSGLPPGYRVVSAREFEAFHRTGELPAGWAADPADLTSADLTSADRADEDPAGDRPVDDGAAARDRAADDDAAAANEGGAAAATGGVPEDRAGAGASGTPGTPDRDR